MLLKNKAKLVAGLLGWLAKLAGWFNWLAGLAGLAFWLAGRPGWPGWLVGLGLLAGSLPCWRVAGCLGPGRLHYFVLGSIYFVLLVALNGRHT